MELELTRTKDSSTTVHFTEGTRSNVQQVLQRIQKLPISGEGGKFERVKEVNTCFVCFGDHPQQKCPNKKPCSLCGSEKHHVLLGRSEKGKADQNSDLHVHAESASHATHGAGLALYPIQQAKVCESGRMSLYSVMVDQTQPT